MINATIIAPSSAEFRNVLETYAKGSTKAFNDSLLSRLRDIIIKAYMYTRMADRAKIEQTLGVVGYTISTSKKTGKLRRRKAILDLRFSLAELIIQKRHRFGSGTGLNMPRAQAREKARKMIAAIVRTIGFIRSGWIPAMRALDRKVKEGRSITPDRAGTGQQRGQPKGYFKSFEGGDRMFFEAGNTTKVAAPIGEQALQRARSESMAYMKQKIAEGQQRELDKIHGKVIR